MEKKRATLLWPEKLNPNSTQSYLLNSCLAETKEDFVKNWKDWKATQDFDVIDLESLKLIPLLNKQIERFNIEDAEQPLYQGVYKKSWVTNHQLFKKLTPVFEDLQKQNLSFLVAGNTALIKNYYKDEGLIKMHDVELILKREEIEHVVAIFFSNDFSLKNKKITEEEAINLVVNGQRLVLLNNENYAVTLSVRLFAFYTNEEACGLIWNEKHRFALNNVSLATLSPENLLLQVVVNGLSDKRIPQLQWVIDAKAILNKEGATFNWNEFVRAAKKHEVSLLASMSLHYLLNLGLGQLPETIIQQLAETPTNNDKLIVDYVVNRNKPTALRFYIFVYFNINKQKGVSLISYLKALFRINSTIEIPLKMIKKMVS